MSHKKNMSYKIVSQHNDNHREQYIGILISQTCKSALLLDKTQAQCLQCDTTNVILMYVNIMNKQ